MDLNKNARIRSIRSNCKFNDLVELPASTNEGNSEIKHNCVNVDVMTNHEQQDLTAELSVDCTAQQKTNITKKDEKLSESNVKMQIEVTGQSHELLPINEQLSDACEK